MIYTDHMRPGPPRLDTPLDEAIRALGEKKYAEGKKASAGALEDALVVQERLRAQIKDLEAAVKTLSNVDGASHIALAKAFFNSIAVGQSYTLLLRPYIHDKYSNWLMYPQRVHVVAVDRDKLTVSVRRHRTKKGDDLLKTVYTVPAKAFIQATRG